MKRWYAARGTTGATFSLLGAIFATSVYAAEHSSVPSGLTDGVIVQAGQHLAQAVQIPTVSYDDRPSPDPATLQSFKSFLETIYPTAHQVMHQEEVNHHALLYSWVGSDTSAPPIIFLAHMDVVPAEEQGDVKWKYPAFSGRIAEDRVNGRGSIDMKGQLISIFEAVEALAKAGYTPRRTIYICLGSDEETAGSGAQAIADVLRSRQVHAEFILDEGPFVIDPFELTGKRAAFIGVAEKGYGTFVVTATDHGGHSAAPPPQPALLRLSQAVIAIDRMPLQTGFTATDKQLLKALSPDMSGITRVAVNNLWFFGPLVKGRINSVPAGRALLGTTLAPTMMQGSTKENELPSVATALINVRIHPRDTADALLNEAQTAVHGISGVTVNWEAPPNAPTAYASTQSPAYALISKHIHDFAGSNVPIAPVLLPGATDSRYYAGLADNTYLFQPFIMTEDEGNEIHGRDEALSLGNLRGAIIFFYGLLQDASSNGVKP